MRQKPFVDRDLPGPAGGAYSAPTGPLPGLRGWRPQRGEGNGEKENWRGVGREKAGEKGQGGEKGTKEKERGGKGKGEGKGQGFCLR